MVLCNEKFFDGVWFVFFVDLEVWLLGLVIGFEGGGVGVV